MEKLSLTKMKILEAIHLISVSIWMTCVLILCIMALVFKNFDNFGEIYMYNRIFHLIDINILPHAAMFTLVTGTVYSTFTSHGLFRDIWHIYKWIVTFIIIIAQTFYLAPMATAMLGIARDKGPGALSDSYYIYGLRVTVISSSVIAIILILTYIFAIYKPFITIRKLSTVKTLPFLMFTIFRATHLISASIWMTSALILCIMVFVFKNFVNLGEIYMYNKVFHFIGIKILTPAAVFTLITGFIFSTSTNRGLFRQPWLIFKSIMALIIIVAGAFYSGPMVTEMLAIARDKGPGALSDSYYNYGLRVTVLYASITAILLILAYIFSAYRPWMKLKTDSE